MSEDLEITFGKTVLIEKCPNDVISLGISHLCGNTHQSKIHCLVSAKGWLTTIRHSNGVAMCGKEYSVFRIVMLKKKNKNITVQEMSFDYNEGTDFLGDILICNSNPSSFYKLDNPGFILMDSGFIICHKNALIHSIKHSIAHFTKKTNLMGKNKYRRPDDESGLFKFGWEKEIKFTGKGHPPCKISTITNNCSSMYGRPTKESKVYLNKNAILDFKKETNKWLSANRKAKFETGNSIIVKSI